jgi:hypothetical protein
MERLHNQHNGLAAMRKHVSKMYFWPGIDKYIDKTFGECAKCLEVPDRELFAINILPEETQPLQCVTVTLYWKKHMVFVILCDRYSCMTWSERIAHQMPTCITPVLDHWFRRLGYPCRMLTPDEAVFRQDFGIWCESRHIKRIVISQTFVDENPMPAWSVLETERLLRESSNTESFENLLQQWRNSPSWGTDSTPSQMFFGRKQRCGLATLPAEILPSVLRKGRLSFPIGTHVRLQNPITRRWDNKGKIVSIRESGRSYGVQRDEGGVILIRNSRFLKPIADQTDAVWKEVNPPASGRPSDVHEANQGPSQITHPLPPIASSPPIESEPRRSTRAREAIALYPHGRLAKLPGNQ